MATGIVAATMISLNIGRRATGYGFAVFAFSSVVWMVYGANGGEFPILIQNGVLLVINLLGVYRWLVIKAP